MQSPQPGIFALGSRSQLHLELDVGGSPAELRRGLTEVWEAAGSVAGVNLVVGLGARILDGGAPGATPTGFGGFEPITGVDDFEMPAAQHDLWLWLQATAQDSLFDLARLATSALAGVADLASEQPSFAYRASQDLTGFEDGTENPSLVEAPGVATIGDGEPGAGGSVVLLQRWVHDLDGFEALSVPDQESVIGRTLHGSVELDDDRQPPTSHVSRVVVEDDDGEELEVFRRSTAFGGVNEHGLMFLAFSADVDRLHRMLVRMSGGEDGIRDRLTEFSTPTASAWYYAPPIEVFSR